jgi:N-acetylated-alpha-linked acidic dipeptidase
VRLAEADLLPFEFGNLADTTQTYVRELQALLRQRQDDVRERNRQISDGVLAAINDPKEPRPIPRSTRSLPRSTSRRSKTRRPR